ncbi:MAG: sulfite exporter TauE/SafE family protein [Alphaproteobacteria bacterium]|nr:sulfite exporter TauE/SafE family protein [Alphaproteobacteria bacterium]
MSEFAFIMAVAGFAFALAGFVKGVLGQGLPTVAIGVLALIMSPGEATALLIIPALLTNIWQAWAGPALWPLLRRLWPTLLAIALGTWIATALGLGLLTPEAASIARKTLGVTLILYGILGLSNVNLRTPRRYEPWLGPAMGAANGAVSTATGVFMVPVIPYIASLGLDRDELVQAQGISFTVSTSSLSLVLIANGTLHVGNAAASLLAVVVAVLGMMLGQYVRKLARPEIFRILFFLGMLALGFHLAFLFQR